MILTWEIAGVLATLIALCLGALGKWIKSSIDAESERRGAAALRIEDAQADMKSDLQTINDNLDRRVDRLEQKSQSFMPRQEIVSSIDHEKANRMMSDESIKKLVDQNTAQIIELKVHIGKLESSHDGLAAQVGEVKQMLREQGVSTNARLDKIADSVAEIAKKVG